MKIENGNTKTNHRNNTVKRNEDILAVLILTEADS
jgi:hypothetical protein